MCVTVCCRRFRSLRVISYECSLVYGVGGLQVRRVTRFRRGLTVSAHLATVRSPLPLLRR